MSPQRMRVHCCAHQPACPSADEPGHAAARVVCCHPEQGWSLLCNGVIVFEDTGEILPDGRPVAPGAVPEQSDQVFAGV